LIIGSIELIWGLVIKFLPTGLFTCITMDDSPKEEEEEAHTMVSRLKASSRLTKPESKKMANDLGAALVNKVKAK